MNTELIKQIYKIHLGKLNQKYIFRKRVIICFSGIVCSGKSTLANLIEERYHGIRIENNWIRKKFIATKKGDSDTFANEVDDFVKNYLDYFFKNYNFPNRLFIFDSSIDRKYNFIKDFVDKNNYKLFIIRLNVPKETAEKRAFERKGGVDNWFVKNINRWVDDFEKFNNKHKADLILNNEEELDLNAVFQKLDKIIL